MQNGKLSIDPAFIVAPVNRRLFGSFVEHMGRCVYGGIYEPGHPTSDDNGFRGDVLELVRELGVTAVRYPGGNFVSGYKWEDGVGPVDRRPTRLDPAWQTIETNAFGLNEFMQWARKADVEPIMADQPRHPWDARGARRCWSTPTTRTGRSCPTGASSTAPRSRTTSACGAWATRWTGPGSWATRPPTSTAGSPRRRRAAMRQFDGDLELVACGSSGRSMPTFGAWEATVLEHTYDVVDFVSAHAYYQLEGDDVASFLASSVDMDLFIHEVVATADHVGAKLSSPKKINISFDEWNVWYLRELQQSGMPEDWTVRPAAQRGRLHRARRRRGRVPAHHPAQAQRPGDRRLPGPAGQHDQLDPVRAGWAGVAAVDLPPVRADRPARPGAGAPAAGRRPRPWRRPSTARSRVLDSVATYDAEEGRVAVFVVNRHPSEPVSFSTDLRAFGSVELGRGDHGRGTRTSSR